MRLQRTAGNQAVQRLLRDSDRPVTALQRKPKKKVTSYDFEEGETITVPTHTVAESAEGSAVKEINQIVGDQVTNLRSTQTAFRTGIDNFSEFQKFADEKEAKADYAGVVLKFATKQIIEAALKELAESIPYVDKIYKITFGLIDELEKEHKRALKAGSEVAVRNYISDYRDLVTNVFNEWI